MGYLCGFGLSFVAFAELDVLDGVSLLVSGHEAEVLEDVQLLQVLLSYELEITLLELALSGDGDLFNSPSFCPRQQ